MRNNSNSCKFLVFSLFLNFLLIYFVFSFRGNYPEALLHYETALQDNLSPDHTAICRAGIARTSLHCGNPRHAISIAVEMADDQLYQECAAILENKRQHNEAAALYEKCRQVSRKNCQFYG